MTAEPTLSERLVDMHHRKVDRWSHADQATVGKAIWALRSLEAIADAQRCEHGMINGHPTDDPYHPYIHGLVKNWCPGAPKLRSLLDALTEDDTISCAERSVGEVKQGVSEK